MPITQAIRGHGTFIYEPVSTFKRYGSEDLTVAALRSMGIQHAWVRIPRSKPTVDNEKTKKVIDKTNELIEMTRNLIVKLKYNGISVAGWGWYQGHDIKKDIKDTKNALQDFELSDYVVDIENGVNHSHWDEEEIEEQLEGLRNAVSGALVVSTFPIIDWHEPDLMRAAEPFVDAFAPQAYWFHYPDHKMQKAFGRSLKVDDPAEYVRLTISRWRALTNKPLVITGQAYWGEGGLSRTSAETKLSQFLANVTDRDWGEMIGFNWWHSGGDEAMSPRMVHDIATAQLAHKPFRGATLASPLT